MLKFLILVEDLRVNGSSEGIVSRSFIGKLRKAYSNALIDVVYITFSVSDDRLDLLPINNIEKRIINTKIPFLIKYINLLLYKIFSISFSDIWVLKKYRRNIVNIPFTGYNYVFVRSAGYSHYLTRSLYDLPILNKAIINFHDPFPELWNVGNTRPSRKLDFSMLQQMTDVVKKSNACFSPSKYLSDDLKCLYGYQKKFFVLPHQFYPECFPISNETSSLKKRKKVSIFYHGIILPGQNIELILDAYKNLVSESVEYANHTEFILRIKGSVSNNLKIKYKDFDNILLLDIVDFQASYYELKYLSDIIILLEKGVTYSNVLVGKSPLLDYIGKPILCISPLESELRNIINNEDYIADVNNISEVQIKLKKLIDNVLIGFNHKPVFGDYFSINNFKFQLQSILNYSK